MLVPSPGETLQHKAGGSPETAPSSSRTPPGCSHRANEPPLEEGRSLPLLAGPLPPLLHHPPSVKCFKFLTY